MLKKIILAFLMTLTISTAHAEKENPFDKVQSMGMNELATMLQNRVYREELLVEMLFAMAPEYHQYVMPMIANAYGISEKTRMMPGIVEWRRKLPTRIAPELEEYAKVHLRYLNPIFYPFLMPEGWPSFHQGHEEETEKMRIPQEFSISSAADMEQLFPSIIPEQSPLNQMFNPVSVPNTANFDGPPLTKGEVGSVIRLFDKLKALEDGTEGRKRRNTLIVDYIDQDLLLKAMLNPCSTTVARLNKIDADKWFALQVEKEGMKPEEFGAKCDRVLNAYRMRLLSPSLARDLVRRTKEALALPEGNYTRSLNLMILHMYDTTKEDVAAVKGSEEALKKTFLEKNMVLGTPLLVDF